MSEFRPVEGNFEVAGARFAIVVSRWNSDVTEGLLRGALRALERHGIPSDTTVVSRVPGAFELPLAAKVLADSGRFDAVITLGCVIRGDTPHFDYVCSECARGVGEAALSTGIPVAFGVLTTDNLAQALSRSRDDEENKGEEAALSAMEMASLLQQLRG